MLNLKTLLSTLAFIQISTSMSLPDYITACSRSDPRIDECMVDHANKALPFVLKGDEKFNIPNLLPLKVPRIDITSMNNLNMQFSDCELHGLQSAVVTGMHNDFDERKTTIEVDVDRLNVLAQYNISGRILILPVVGQGPANITIANGKYKYEFTFDLNTRKSGKQHVKFTWYNLEFKADRIYFKLDNLFNGDQMLGETMNRFLDENWRDVTEELYPALKDAVGAIVTSIAKGLFSKIPFDDLYLP